MKMNAKLLEVLCCPKCKGSSNLTFDEKAEKLNCDQCSRTFTVKKVSGPDGQGMLIPELLINEED